MEKTDEFSFVLKPSEHGIGVFVTHDVKRGTYLRLFGETDRERPEDSYRFRNKKDVPPIFHQYCVDREELLSCPVDFGTMPIGWYLNHSTTPNAVHRNYDYYAARDIAADEEILIDYNTLEEPESAKEGYY